MKLLFVFCEGPHDAQFIGRLLKESKQYIDYNEPLNNYPIPLGKFIEQLYGKQDISSININHPRPPLVPHCVSKKNNAEYLVLAIPLGGMDQYKIGKKLLDDIKEVFSFDVLRVTRNAVI